MPRLLFAALINALAIFAINLDTSFACDHCAQVCPCQKTCRLVCETKKVEITCWGCKCEEFCVPGPSKPGCKHCEMVCEDCDAACDPNGVHYQPHKFVWMEWMPGCAKIQTRKKLMKKTITKTIPSYKWVVEELCPHCQTHAQSASAPAGTALPRLPALAATTAILPVQHTAETATFDQVTDESSPGESFPVQPATFMLPQSPTSLPAANKPAAAAKSWRDSFKLPWQR